MTCRAMILAPLVAIFPTMLAAQPVALPSGAVLAIEKAEDLGSYEMPIAEWENGALQTIWTEGAVTRQAWQLPTAALTTLQILAPLRRQLTDAGYDVLFECETEACGGFDFRYETEVLPEPEMHVDLGDFRFLAAQKIGPERPDYVSLLVSRSSEAGFIQIVSVGEETGDSPEPVASSKSPSALTLVPAASGKLANRLIDKGFFVLEDLEFTTGSSALGANQSSSLVELADLLNRNPDMTVALVGHTDAEGSLANNVALSKKRAHSVVKRLVSDLGVKPQQVRAEGMGFLSPRASNLTEEGRTLNRRVEVILTSIR